MDSTLLWILEADLGVRVKGIVGASARSIRFNGMYFKKPDPTTRTEAYLWLTSWPYLAHLCQTRDMEPFMAVYASNA